MLSTTTVRKPSFQRQIEERFPSIEDDLVNNLIRYKQLLKLNIPSLNDFHLTLFPVETEENDDQQFKESRNLSSLLRECEDSHLNRSGKAKNCLVTSPQTEKLCRELNISKIKDASSKLMDDDVFSKSCKSIKLSVNKFKQIQYDQCKRFKMLKRLVKVVNRISENRRRSGLEAMMNDKTKITRISTVITEKVLCDTIKFDFKIVHRKSTAGFN